MSSSTQANIHQRWPFVLFSIPATYRTPPPLHHLLDISIPTLLSSPSFSYIYLISHPLTHTQPFYTFPFTPLPIGLSQHHTYVPTTHRTPPPLHPCIPHLPDFSITPSLHHRSRHLLDISTTSPTRPLPTGYITSDLRY